MSAIASSGMSVTAKATRPSNHGSTSAAHTEVDIDKTISAFAHALDLQVVAGRFEQGPRGLHRIVDHRGQLQLLGLQFDVAARDARDIQQVVDQAAEL